MYRPRHIIGYAYAYIPCVRVCVLRVVFCVLGFVWVGFVCCMCTVYVLCVLHMCKCVKVIAHIYTIKVHICTQVYYSLCTLKGFTNLSGNIKLATSGYHTCRI